MKRAGSSLVELMMTLMALAIIGVACAALVRSQSLLLRNSSERAAAAEALRAGQTILRAELQDALGPDRHAVAVDSIALRVFRGIGIVCAINQTRVTMRYQGLRQPDASKDSLLVPGLERIGTIRQISSRIDPCSTRPGEQLVAIEPDFPLPVGSPVLFFETGSYHLAANALRYRRGNGGLQPITDDLIDHARSRFAMDSGGQALMVALRSTAAPTAFLQQADARIGMRNR